MPLLERQVSLFATVHYNNTTRTELNNDLAVIKT